MPNPDGTLRRGEFIPPGTVVESIHEINIGCRATIKSSRRSGIYCVYRLVWEDKNSVPYPENIRYADAYIKVVKEDPRLKKFGIGKHINNRR